VGETLFACYCSLKHPVIASYGGKIFLLSPPSWFIRMSPVGPWPSRVKNRLVYLDEGLRAGDVPVIMCPSLPNRIELPDPISSRRLGVPYEYSSDFRSHGLHILLRWCDEHLAILVAASMLSKEVKAILNLSDPGFFW